MEPPDPIPNSEVKRTCADGSVHLACESRSSPGFLPRNPRPQGGGFFLRAISTRHYSSDGFQGTSCKRCPSGEPLGLRSEAPLSSLRTIETQKFRENVPHPSGAIYCKSGRFEAATVSRMPGDVRQRVDDCQPTRMARLDCGDEMGLSISAVRFNAAADSPGSMIFAGDRFNRMCGGRTDLWPKPYRASLNMDASQECWPLRHCVSGR